MKKKSESFTQALVGLFMITVLLLLGYFTIVISGVDVLAGRNRVPVKFAFSQVGGLKDRDNVMYRGTKVGAIEEVMEKAAGKLCEDVKLFDIFRGEKIGEGKKSVAFRVILRAPDRTLTVEEADKVSKKILNDLKFKMGLELRG
jgi:hypothetical protein